MWDLINMLHEIDPASCAVRWGLSVRRRTYSVPSANYLWHLDTHLALCKWRMVSAGCIDGHSRLVVYLSISDNNRAQTVLDLFLHAVHTYLCPSRVRADAGVENVGVRQYMEEIRGRDRGSFISGRSCHNTRIERLWRDVMYAVIQTYYSIFYYLESMSELDVDDEVDLFCLHLVYLPLINSSLQRVQACI